MNILMNIDNLKTINSVRRFLNGSLPVAFTIKSSKLERYTWIQGTLIKYNYFRLSKKNKGLIVQLLCKVSGYSRQQITRLIRQYKKTGRVAFQHSSTNGFKARYTKEDVTLLAKTDEIHLVKSGAAIKKICERAYGIHGQIEYERLASISISHLYNLRQSKSYRQIRQSFDKTKNKRSDIGKRKKPQPNGKPGYIRIDTVHQGDLDGAKGVYHINAVDEVTQFEIVASIEKISENYLLPALEQLIDQFPFKIISIHSDNGSEYINKKVAKLLGKLLIEMTKSRARHSNDNALAESKNAAIARRAFGYIHLKQKTAQRINEFNQKYLNPYINFHRPCYFPETKTDKKGKQVKTYPYKNMMTPYDKLKSLPNADLYLKKGVTFKDLDLIANEINDNEAAELLQSNRNKLFQLITGQNRVIA